MYSLKYPTHTDTHTHPSLTINVNVYLQSGLSQQQGRTHTWHRSSTLITWGQMV